tara:strand:- start:415 stop:633 length:219 start_codon:yes stop_codon:yes gene_type:complete
MKGLSLTKKLAVWFTVTICIFFYLFSVAVLPGPNLTLPVILVATSGVHLAMLLWILLTTVIPFIASSFDLEI